MTRVTDENVEDIIEAAAYGGITYWADSASEEEWAAHPDARFVVREYGDSADPIVRSCTVADVRAATWGLFRNPEKYGVSRDSYARGYIVQAFTLSEESDGGIDCGFIDADAADLILQAALLGRVIYG